MRPSRETFGERTKTHGMTNTRLYSVWCGIKDRCYNKNVEHYDRYGGRGVTVCEDWKQSFESFRDWAMSNGYDESLSGREQSLDRIDVNGNYAPSNCRWVSMKEQARNRSDTVYVQTDSGPIPARAFAEKENITDYVFVFRRAKAGDSGEKIVHDWNLLHDTPDCFITVKEAMELYQVTDQSIRSWIKSGKLKAEKVGAKLFIYKNQ